MSGASGVYFHDHIQKRVAAALRKPLRPLLHLPPKTRALIAGLGSGVIVAGVFNPWDRALYLSVKDELPFLRRSNFRQPYQGFWQALFGRTLSGGLYFPLFDIFRAPAEQLFHRSASESALVACVAGNAAGAVNGVVMNLFAAVKYETWGHPEERQSFVRAARHMWRAGGVRPFLKGIAPTLARDTIFGGTFASIKYLIMEHTRARAAKLNGSSTGSGSGGGSKPLPLTISPLSSLFAASFACIAASPFNYARNMKYATPPGETPPTTMGSIATLIRDSKKVAHAGHHPALSHLQNQLRIGWGTARVAVGMAVGYELYELLKITLYVDI